jgi:hypothetical protein
MAGDYDNRRSAKDPDRLTPEEFEVQQALNKAEYRFDPYQVQMFVPTKVLFQVYRRYIAGLRYRGDGYDVPVDLSIRQFGAALNRVYPEPEKVRRTWHGKRCWGYLGIIGPETLQTQDERGRPRHDTEDD